MHKILQLPGLRPLDPHQWLCPWTPPGPLSGAPKPWGSRALRASILTLGALNFSLAQGPGKGKSGTVFCFTEHCQNLNKNDHWIFFFLFLLKQNLKTNLMLGGIGRGWDTLLTGVARIIFWVGWMSEIIKKKTQAKKKKKVISKPNSIYIINNLCY